MPPPDSDTPPRKLFGRVISLSGLLILLGLGFLAFCGSGSPGGPAWSVAQEPKPPSALSSDLRLEVEQFCADCHAMPDPQAFPKPAWMDEVRRGFRFYTSSGRQDLKVPRPLDVAAYFRELAPDKISLPEGAVTPIDDVSRFERATYTTRDADSKPAISYLRSITLDRGEPPRLLSCDMGSGEVALWKGPAVPGEWQVIARLGHPAHAEACDLDGDGELDLVVADLGTFSPSDKLEGKVTWLRRTGPMSFEPRELQRGLGRVADVQPADVDGDGDLDLIVAEFGWQTAGRILLLRNDGLTGGTPRFALEVIDPRHGTIHVPPVDLNGDGHLDFIALVSQEHEVVEAFLNDGTGHFRSEVLHAAREPSWGSSGIQLTDLDGDGDLDVLYTNGDTFDSFYLKPFHGIQWLENQGRFPYVVHRLTNLPGVHRAVAADLDGDGDLDIAACAMLPSRLTRRNPNISFDAVIWLEQTGPGVFERHTLKNGGANHAALEAADFDGDGLLDLAVGEFAEKPGAGPVEFWWNRPAGQAK